MRHQLPDGTHHFDLLLAATEIVADQAREVATWRCEMDPCVLTSGTSTTLQRIAPHRGLYLRLREARELGGDRGCVTPTRAGMYTMREGLLELRMHDHSNAQFHMHDDRLERLAL